MRSTHGDEPQGHSLRSNTPDLETAMNFHSHGRTDIAPFTISQTDIDEVMRRARAERAEILRAAFARLATRVKAVFARSRPNRQRLPKGSAWA
jgi:hypothetical protein